VRQILMHDVAEDAALLDLEVTLGAVDLLAHEVGHDRQRDQLRMRVLERRARGGAVVLEDQNVLQPPILLQIEDALAIRREDALGAVPFSRYAITSCGVICSCPGQNGHCSRPIVFARSNRKSFGRFCRSVEMMTHRPVTGSLRSSGKSRSWTSVVRRLKFETRGSGNRQR